MAWIRTKNSASDTKPRRAHWVWYVAIAMAALLPRLILLNSPPTGHHGWRQSDTAAVARNFATEEFNIFRPRMDWRGDGPGYVEMEFPLYPAAAAGVYRLIGVHHWIPRLLAAFGATLAVLLMFELVTLTHGYRIAAWVAIVFAWLPAGVFFGRAIMPEAWLLLAIVAGVYYFTLWSRTGKLLPLAGSAVAIAAAILLKLPALHVGLPLLFLAWSRLGFRCLFHPLMLVYAVTALAPGGPWYWHAAEMRHQYGNTFGVLHSDKWGSIGPLLTARWYHNMLGNIGADHLGVLGLPLLAMGVMARGQARRNGMYLAWALACVIYLLLAARGNQVHDYYQIPMTPVMAFFIGRALESWWQRRPIAIVVVCITFLATSTYFAARLFSRELPGNRQFDALASALAGCTSPNELVVFVGDWGQTDPCTLYLAGRKGWALGAEEISPEHLDQLIKRGAVALGALPTRWDARERAAALRSMTTPFKHEPCADPEAVVVRLRPRKSP